MALGLYNVSEHGVHNLLDTYNSTFQNDVGLRLAGFTALDKLLFKNSSTAKAWEDFSGTSQVLGGGAQLFIEFGSNEPKAPSPPIEITTDHHHTVIIVASSGDVSLVDNGSTGDTGDMVVAGSGNDSIQVIQGNNLVIAGGGMDTLQGGSGSDSLWGGGQTLVEAGTGNQNLYGGFASSASDTLVGGQGHDFLKVYDGNNSLYAGSGTNTLDGGRGNDQLFDTVGGGHSYLNAGSGFQTLDGGASTASADTIRAGSGDDTISVAAGNNRIYDGSGNFDSISSGDGGAGGAGDSIILLYGAQAQVNVADGTGTDSVYFGNAYGFPTQPGEGDATINASGAVNIYLESNEHLNEISADGGATTLTFADGQTLTYEGDGSIQIHFNAF